MPSRIVREGILTSEPVNSLSDPAENLYRRMMNVVDDYGRYFGHPGLVRAAAYPLKLETVSERDVQQRLAEIAATDLIEIYEVAGKKYIQLNNFRQRTRSDSKFPAPCLANDGQSAVNPPSSVETNAIPIRSRSRSRSRIAETVGGGVVGNVVEGEVKIAKRSRVRHQNGEAPSHQTRLAY